MLKDYRDLMYIRFDDDTVYYVKPGTFRLTEAGWSTVRDSVRVSVPTTEDAAKNPGVAVV